MYTTKLASGRMPFWNMLEKANIDPLPLFKKAGLDPALMHQANARYSDQRFLALLKEVSKKVNDECFWLTIDSCWHPSHLSTLGYVLLMSKSLRDTLERLIRYHKVLSDSPVGELRESKLRGTLTCVAMFEGGFSARMPAQEDYGLAWAVSLLRMNYEKDFAPISVDFTHPAPDCSHKFYEYFQCPINFDSEYCSLTISVEVADELLPAANQELDAFSDHLMARYLKSLSEHNLVTRVKKSIIEHLPSGEARVDKVASDVYMSTRSLQRALQGEETSFHKLLNEARMELAMDYVADPNMDLTEVAFLLGFSEQSSFSRSFKRWTGNSPAQQRKTV
jgi:AraC-like DNA-binding protein